MDRTSRCLQLAGERGYNRRHPIEGIFRNPRQGSCMYVARFAPVTVLLAVTAGLPAQEPDPAKLKSAVILWVADSPQLTYDIRFAGGESTTMPTALRYLVKDLAENDGWYLTGEDKSKTVASQAKRISLEYTAAKSKIKTARVGRIEVKETPKSVACVVSFSKKPGADDVKRLSGVLQIFARKYTKAAKSVVSTVEPAETMKATVWTFEVRFKEPAKKDKK